MRTVPVSVVVPVRNGALFVGAALQSIFQQTWVPQEVIVVDDGSSDGTAKEVERFARATYIRQPPFGAAEARNAGVKRASTPYIAFLDADDMWSASKTEIQLGFLSENPGIDIVSGQMVQFRHSTSGEMTPLSAPASAYLPGLMLMRLEAFWRVGPYSSDSQISETVDWWSRAMDVGVSFHTLAAVVLMRRIHAHNSSLSAERPMQAYLRTLHTIVKRRRGPS